MIDIILELIDFNESVDYSVVTKIVLAYLVLLWIFVSIWVFNDAKYRFNNMIIAILLGILNLVLSFPFLLIYLLVRPSHRDDDDDFSEEGGVNIPIVNFTKDDGVVISLQLKIDSKKIVEDKIDYKLDVALTKDDNTVIPGRVEISASIPEKEETEQTKVPFTVRLRTKMKSLIESFKEKVGNLKSKLSGKLKRKENVTVVIKDENLKEDEKVLPAKETRSKKKKNKSKKKKRK